MVPYKRTKLLAIPPFKQAGTPWPEAHTTRMFLRGHLGLLALDRQCERKGNIAHLIFGQLFTVVLGQHRRAIERHGICERKTLLYVRKQRIVNPHAVFEANRKRNDMTRKGSCAAQDRYAGQSGMRSTPLKHLGNDIPHLVRDDQARVVIRRRLIPASACRPGGWKCSPPLQRAGLSQTRAPRTWQSSPPPQSTACCAAAQAARNPWGQDSPP